MVSARVMFAAVAVTSLAACSEGLDKFNPFADEKYKPEKVIDTPPEQLYNDGLARAANGNFAGAAKRFDEVIKIHPHSSYAKQALLMSAYANYEAGAYDDAIGSAKRYVTLYPSDKDAAYAQYLLAMSHYSMAPDVSRDQEQAEKAGQALHELVTRYPSSEYVKDSKWKIQVIRDQLAGKEMEVGRYYLNRRNYGAAINRFRVVISRYQNTRHVEEALERLVEAYMAMGITNEAQTAAAVLGHNFPDSQWYHDAHALLTKGGLAPREDKGSWISQAFGKTFGRNH